ncbi:ferritin-like domain-containing protein [Telluribacter sp. SYSU D00476]|uniref:ferritin-like domain-containing protein n=1 Tax=Telluribacter sp. SYSU D00476 TaxID=2811430 RepID=UPI001FF4FC09|nr:ferritin-like domain-containing protein [Telluribacter sp. SYSU D00476]
MSIIKNPFNNPDSPDNQIISRVGRRFFLRSAGLTAVTGAFILGACQDHDMEPDATVDLGSGDIGILNYAYALEQLEAAFYTQVIDMAYSGMTAEERRMLTDIRDHEIIHREFLKAALGTSAIPGLEVNFSSINFNDRASVLGTARVLEDTGVAAYNGAGKYLQDVQFLLVAGKIVSVEARHAAAIRDLLQPRSRYFAGDDVVDANGLDVAKEPAMILADAQPFIETRITANNLPK